MNRLDLYATLVQRSALRHTPAGLPALDLVLKHESTVQEDGLPRKVSLEMRVVGIGAVTQPLAALALGGEARFGGFLTAARNGRGLVMHVTEVQALLAKADAAGPTQ